MPEIADNCIVLSTPVYDGRVNVIVFPDPCHDHVTVNGDYVGPLEICDASGRVVRVPMVTSNGAVDLDVSGIQAGLYWISGTSTGRRLLGKFIKE